ncbi:hypothetical protein EYF80_049328 [Liparis tanakae]|uniref:Uncharacterized protein n=1 Tax=Liparis tanakae TaxID=230148 RepID=A0A4Z2FH34_9TELE|nr:hypothetical protein EYF80_049328 [Liparis tanakae]
MKRIIRVLFLLVLLGPGGPWWVLLGPGGPWWSLVVPGGPWWSTSSGVTCDLPAGAHLVGVEGQDAVQVLDELLEGRPVGGDGVPAVFHHHVPEREKHKKSCLLREESASFLLRAPPPF